MKVTFIDPPVLIGNRNPERVFGCTYSLYPIPNIFLLLVCAVLKEHSHDVYYKNFPLEKCDVSDFIEYLSKDDSDIYAINSVNLAKENDIETHKLIRAIKEKIPVVFFGPAPTYEPKYFLKDANTFVVRGEPEYTFLELVNSFSTTNNLEDIKGLSYYLDNKYICNEGRKINTNLDNLPLPARELLDTIKYFNPKFGDGKWTAMLTSRGCPYQCTYCVPNSLSFAREIDYKNRDKNKPKYVTRSAENVVKEFKLLSEKGFKYVSILDDEFMIDKERVMEICNGIKNLKIEWGCLARPDSLDEELVRSVKEAGCKYIDIGVESYDQDILDDINKSLRVETIEKAIALTKKYKIFTKINILFGSSKLEDKFSIKHTMDKIGELKPDSVMFGICNPFPGTEHYDIAKENNWFVNGDYYPVDVQKESTISLPNISKSDLEKSVRKANLGFFLNPIFVIKNLTKIKSPNELINKLGVFKKKIFK